MTRTNMPSSVGTLFEKLTRFSVIGVLATLAYGLFAITLSATFSLSPITVHLVAYALSIPISFWGQANFTFRYRDNFGPAFFRFVVTAGIALALSSLGVYLVDDAGWPPILGTLLTMLIVPGVSFVIMSTWVFVPPDEQLADGGDSSKKRARTGESGAEKL